MSFGLPRLSINYLKYVFNPIMIFAYGFLHTFRVGSVYVTLAVTFERFHAIICPLRHFKRKKYMLPACTIFAIVYNLPKYFELQIKVSMINRHNRRLSRNIPLFYLMFCWVHCSSFLLGYDMK